MAGSAGTVAGAKANEERDLRCAREDGPCQLALVRGRADVWAILGLNQYSASALTCDETPLTCGDAGTSEDMVATDTL